MKCDLKLLASGLQAGGVNRVELFDYLEFEFEFEFGG